MIKHYLTLIVCFSVFSFFGQGWQPVGARSMSLANSSVALEDVWSFHHNPAGLAAVSKVAAGLSYENRYLLKELQTQAAVIAVPLKVGVISVGIQSYGYRVYRTNRIGLGYSMKLAERFSAGVQLNYQGLRIENYDSKSTMTAEVGFMAQLSSKVKMGFSLMNLGKSRVSSFQDDRFSTYMRLGIGYEISKKVLLLLEAEKEISSKIRPKIGVEYQLVPQFFFRCGFAYHAPEITAGIGYYVKHKFKIDVGTAWQQHLGWCPHAGFTYELSSLLHD